MGTLFGKRILLGITGGIAAYKSAELTRQLVKSGAAVRVIMTRSAEEFVTRLTFQALSGHPVHTELLDEEAEAGMGHIELARWADVVLVAPASANSIANLAQGRSDDLLGAVCLATRSPVVIAPAMNTAMWHNLATQTNIRTLAERGIHILSPGSGELACGEIGEGRMMEVEEQLDRLSGLFTSGSLQGRRIIVTAGPTYEAIDPVRFIGNRSSGKMGYAIAEAATEAGAQVTLISGPSHLETPDRVERIDVESADEMHTAVRQKIDNCDIFISAAAVSDYRPIDRMDHKIKKDSETLSLELTRNEDILRWVAEQEHGPFTVGFAAETENLEVNAQAKLQNKQLDLIAANLVGENIGFDSDYNALTVISPDDSITLETSSKRQIARRLIEQIAERYRTTQEARSDRHSA